MCSSDLVRFAKLDDENVPAMLGTSEENRRFEDMMRIYGVSKGDIPPKGILTVNTACPLIKSLEEKLSSGDEKADILAKSIYRLATLSFRRLSGDEMKEFLSESYEILKMI